MRIRFARFSQKVERRGGIEGVNECAIIKKANGLFGELRVEPDMEPSCIEVAQKCAEISPNRAMKTDIWLRGLLCPANSFPVHLNLNFALSGIPAHPSWWRIERGSGSVLLPNGGAGGGFAHKSYFSGTTLERQRLKTVPKGDKCLSLSAQRNLPNSTRVEHT